MTEERAFWLAWSRINGIGPVLLKRLHQQFDHLALAWDASPEALLQVEGIGRHLCDSIILERGKIQPARLLAQHEEKNASFWTPADADYPRLLFEITDPPPLLYYRGQPQIQENQGLVPMISIVGTRSPSDYGRRWTRKLSAALAQRGFTVVSGLADGIDAEAHQACLEVGGRTLGVLGTGVDVVYPDSNRRLHERIAKGQGLLLSEYPNGTQPDRGHFPRRNRIIAGLSRAVLVLEAPNRSGALITARLANDYGRDVYALPGSLDNPRAFGCLALLNLGAQVILSEGHLLDALGNMPELPNLNPPVPEAEIAPSDPPADLEPHLQQVFQTIPPTPISLDNIVTAAQMETGSVLSALAQLELMGLVAQLPGMQYQRDAG